MVGAGAAAKWQAGHTAVVGMKPEEEAEDEQEHAEGGEEHQVEKEREEGGARRGAEGREDDGV